MKLSQFILASLLSTTTYFSYASTATLNVAAATTTNETTYTWNQLSSSKWLAFFAVDSSGNVYGGTKGEDMPSTTGKNVWEFNSVNGWSVLGGKSPDGSEVTSVAIDSKGDIYAGTYGADGKAPSYGLLGSVWEYNKNLGSWIQLGAKSPDNNIILSVVIDSSDNIFAASETGNIWEYNNTNGWVQLGNKPFGAWEWVQLSYGRDGNIYAEDSNENVWKYDSKATNDWIQIIGNGPLGGANGSCPIAINKSGDIDMACLGNNRVYEYDDLAINKNTRKWLGHENLGETIISSLFIDENNQLYASDRRVFKYDKEQNTWNTIGQKSPDDSRINQVVVSNNNIYVITANSGLYEATPDK